MKTRLGALHSHACVVPFFWSYSRSKVGQLWDQKNKFGIELTLEIPSLSGEEI